jgi:hypothetical protein
MLGDRYRSSSKFKVARKRQLRGEEEACRGEEEEQQDLSAKRRGHETGQNASASRNPAEEQQDSVLLQFGEESSTQQWPESISPHQIPPPGFILLEGANTPRDFFGTSSASSSTSSTTTIPDAKEDNEFRSYYDDCAICHQQRQRNMTTTTTRSLQLPEVHSSYDETFAVTKNEHGSTARERP